MDSSNQQPEIQLGEKLKKKKIPIHIYYGIISGLDNTQKSYSYTQSIGKPLEEKLKEEYTTESIKEDKIFSLYRKFYWEHLSIDPTKQRPASEALFRRIISGKGLYKISPFVDGYNWASIESKIPISAYDLSTTPTPLTLRFAQEKESLTLIGGKKVKMGGNEVVISDKENQIITQFPFRDGDSSKIQKTTKKYLILILGIEGISKDELKKAFELVITNLNQCEKVEKPEIQIEKTGYISNF